ncbi:hypothetical protein LHA31_05100 [Carnobacterium viridans]|uniref:Uncharacterized protein n=1 Tax=Carnobacterium viridans TaxID=174587 RepID=A0A1H1AQM1_9LACT|nr:hypothetical protein [Carnobacterium viridans]UDE96097.1 hypothetical protein LHA31_05100 [Carnobacterium viridans]SDQ41910.1 hypothetical protein SAMN04487752_2210 [Carnobacterium viridans]
MHKNENMSETVFNNLTKIGYGYPFKWNEYVIYRTTKDRNLKDLIDYKLSYINTKDKSGNFKNMLEEFRQRFDGYDLPTRGLDEDEV